MKSGSALHCQDAADVESSLHFVLFVAELESRNCTGHLVLQLMECLECCFWSEYFSTRCTFLFQGFRGPSCADVTSTIADLGASSVNRPRDRLAPAECWNCLGRCLSLP